MSRFNTVLWALTLFAFWVLLSGQLDLAHLTMGVVCAAGVALATRPLLAQAPAIGPGVSARLDATEVVRFVRFTLWLLGQIVVGSVQVARVVLHPRLPIAPRMLRLRADLPHPLARLTLAHSITLTPGTVTLDADGPHLLVHALTAASARGLGDEHVEGDMTRRVRAVFTADGEGRR